MKLSSWGQLGDQISYVILERKDAEGDHWYFQKDQEMVKVVISASQKLQLILQEAEWGGGKRIGPGSWGPGSQLQPAAN